ncbi:pyruvate kinase [Geobacter sp. SVR]|uniref:pyruvate kinase n=1 Tax=Geobacter sp. SVR TaxID=2495594 RepID=UPI00143F038E|nr:pyruvate kinase [Geobacter sp. SVR]BCS53506.1 pyruvate kinase [Geobacter sp. SVR]GCF85367.1 pyruvate kinase [Geobacter sp. SVR]
MQALRKTKIVATLGPVSSSPEMIERLINAGVDIFRLNFSHGDYQEKKLLIENIRSTSGKLGVQVGILADLQGPKIRTGRMRDDAMILTRDEMVTITTEEVLGENGIIPTTYKELTRDVRPGNRILLDDGLMELRVASVQGNEVTCTVVTGGTLKNNKGINLPGVRVSAPSLTDKDRQDLDFALAVSVDFIALSFVRTAEDVEELKRLISARGGQVSVVAKIEKPEALKNFSAILRETDAVMVARGDLGVEVQAEKVPVYQKKIIDACNRAGKPVITATQMLDSMVKNPRPTRAETSDVANAIIDGTDAVMLSAETASGDYPIEAVETMAKVAEDIERSGFMRHPKHDSEAVGSIAMAVSEAACQTAMALNARAIVVFTRSGGTAALISHFRPTPPIIAFTASAEIRRKLSIFWGIRCTEIGVMENTDQQINEVEKKLLASGFQMGDTIVITMGIPIETRGSTNLLKVHKLGTHGFYEIF